MTPIDGDPVHRLRDSYKIMLEESVRVLVDQLEGLEGVQQISVFGSFAAGRRDLFTDLDILVIMDTELNVVDRLAFLYSEVSLPVDLDLFCYTPQEYKMLKKGWLSRALRDAQVLYEKRAS